MYHEAGERGRAALLWTVFTFLLGPFSIIVVIYFLFTRHSSGEVFDPLGRYE